MFPTDHNDSTLSNAQKLIVILACGVLMLSLGVNQGSISLNPTLNPSFNSPVSMLSVWNRRLMGETLFFSNICGSSAHWPVRLEMQEI